MVRPDWGGGDSAYKLHAFYPEFTKFLGAFGLGETFFQETGHVTEIKRTREK